MGDYFAFVVDYLPFRGDYFPFMRDYFPLKGNNSPLIGVTFGRNFHFNGSACGRLFSLCGRLFSVYGRLFSLNPFRKKFFTLMDPFVGEYFPVKGIAFRHDSFSLLQIRWWDKIFS